MPVSSPLTPVDVLSRLEIANPALFQPDCPALAAQLCGRAFDANPAMRPAYAIDFGARAARFG